MNTAPEDQQPRTCAFCTKTESLTKEHVWPAALHRRLKKAWDSPGQNYFWLSRLQRDLPNEPVIRDVCASCNNTTLSALDAYICELFDRYFVRIPNKGDTVHFRYDYHRLARWLLKISYNSCRANHGFDSFAFEPLRAYILGESLNHADSIRIFLELSHPTRIPKDDLPEGTPAGTVYVPEVNRIGHMAFRCALGEKIVRAIHLRGYTFLIAFFEPNASSKLRGITTQLFLAQNRGAVLLGPDRQNLYVRPSAKAWNSFKTAWCGFATEEQSQ
jgi:hypothetical protein